MNADWRSRYEVAIEAAAKAGELALSYFDRDIDVEWKSDKSPVTLADRDAEALLRSTLLGRFQGDGFLGEESGDTPSASGYRWIIDPIDGTRSFVRGIPLWATLVGLEYRGELIGGVCRMPAMKQTFRALRGDGAYRDDRKLHVSSVDNLARAHVYYSSISWFKKAGIDRQFLALVDATERQRGFGDFYGFVMVAQGSGEAMLEHGVHPWDVGAIVPLIEEAGGRMTTWDGGRDWHRPDVLASNGLLHAELLSRLAG
jgi:histidinol-phosphatase